MATFYHASATKSRLSDTFGGRLLIVIASLLTMALAIAVCGGIAAGVGALAEWMTNHGILPIHWTPVSAGWGILVGGLLGLFALGGASVVGAMILNRNVK